MFVCPKCKTERLRLHRDHIIPKWQGGSDENNNIQRLCANCHEDKTLLEVRSEAYRQHASERSKSRAVRGPLSLEHREKLRKANLGKTHSVSAEQREKISNALKGKPKSLAARQAMSIAARKRWSS